MLKDLASQKKSDREVILAAINSLKAKGWHINPYTVADEARIARSVIVRSSEYMDLVSKARGKAVATTNQVSDELMRQVDLLEEENRGLKDRLANLTQQCELLALNVQEAFQQGYTTAKAELALASGLQDIVRTGTVSSGDTKPSNDFSNHVPHAQLYETPSSSIPPAPAYTHEAAQQFNSEERGYSGDQTTDYPKPSLDGFQDESLYQGEEDSSEEESESGEDTGTEPLSYSHGDEDEQEWTDQGSEEEDQAAVQSGALQQHDGAQPELYEVDEHEEDSTVETAEHEVFIASHIPELQEEQAVDAFSARLLAALNTEGSEAEVDPDSGLGGQRYDTGEFAETDIPDWDALAEMEEEAWEDAGNPANHSTQPADDFNQNLSALGSIPPPPAAAVAPTAPTAPTAPAAPDPNKFNPDDLRQLVNNQLEHNVSAPHEEPAPGEPASAVHTQPERSNKFVGSNRQGSEALAAPSPVSRMVPPEIRKACLILGIKSDEITRENVNRAWKMEMAKPGVHPDTGGDTEIAIYINNAKESLMKWLDMQAPKLGKKFGGGGGGAKPK